MPLAPRRRRLLLLTSVLALVLTTNADAQISPIDMDGQGVGWDTQLFEHEGGLVQVVTLGSDGRLGQNTFSPGQSDFVVTLRGADGRRIRTLPEGTPIPPSIQESQPVGNLLYSRHRVRATWVLRRSLDGTLRSAARIQHEGRDVKLQGELLPDGGLLLYGIVRRHDYALGLAMRVDVAGNTLWAVETPHTPSPCSEGQGVCRFSSIHDGQVSGDVAILSGTYSSGRVEAQGHALTRRREVNSFRLGLDLNTGSVHWLRRQDTESNPVVVSGEFVNVHSRGNRHELRRIDVSTGQSARMHALRGVQGRPRQIVPFADGVAIFSEGRHADRHLQGYNARGERILYRAGLRPLCQLAASGDSVVLAMHSGGQYPNIERFSVERFAPDGTVQRSEHPGRWRSVNTFVHPLRNGRVVLTAVAHGPQSQLQFIDALTASQPASVAQAMPVHVQHLDVAPNVLPPGMGPEQIHVSVEATVTIGPPAITARDHVVTPEPDTWQAPRDISLK